MAYGINWVVLNFAILFKNKAEKNAMKHKD